MAQVQKAANSRQTKKKPAVRKGTRPKKRDPILACKALMWPEQSKRTPREQQQDGPYRLNLTHSMQKEGRTRMSQATKQIFSLGKRIGLPWITVTWAATDPESAVDGNHPTPEVAVYYWSNGKERVVACDKWNSPVANLRSCTETIQGFWLLIRAGCVHGMSDQMESYTSGLVRHQKQKAPSLMSYSIYENWQKILGIHDDLIDDVFGLPTHEKVVKNALQAAVRIYHPDTATDPDNGASFKLIQECAAYVREQMERIKKIPEQQAQAKKRSRQEAETRSAAREAKKGTEPSILKKDAQEEATDTSDVDREFDQTTQYDDLDQTVDRIAAEGYCQQTK